MYYNLMRSILIHLFNAGTSKKFQAKSPMNSMEESILEKDLKWVDILKFYTFHYL
jgi:hypothetical protein